MTKESRAHPKGAVVNPTTNEAWMLISANWVGCVAEPCDGRPLATEVLFAEAFTTGSAYIPAAVLKERLPRALALAEARQRALDDHPWKITDAKAPYEKFVLGCMIQEWVLRKPPLIVAWE